ncbi:MAG: hypothetical protein NC489_08765 [Ruminococcus flavefaciens]|nr:hypothetical protein [Ruminococcus flavefaciens]
MFYNLFRLFACFAIGYIIWYLVQAFRRNGGLFTDEYRNLQLYAPIPDYESRLREPPLALWFICMSIIKRLDWYQYSPTVHFYLDTILVDQLYDWVSKYGYQYGIADPRIVLITSYIPTTTKNFDMAVKHKALQVTIRLSRTPANVGRNYIVDFLHPYGEGELSTIHDQFTINTRWLKHILKACTKPDYQFLFQADTLKFTCQ